MRARGLRGVRAWPPGTWRLPAGIPVRGVVSVARAHRRAHRADARGGKSGTLRAVSALPEVQQHAEPAVAAHAAADANGRFDDFVLEAVHEGYLLHYGDPNGFAGMDEDLALLAGDSLYALGLARLAEEGDLDAVAMLADLITNCAKAHAERDPGLAGDLWSKASR